MSKFSKQEKVWLLRAYLATGIDLATEPLADDTDDQEAWERVDALRDQLDGPNGFMLVDQLAEELPDEVVTASLDCVLDYPEGIRPNRFLIDTLDGLLFCATEADLLVALKARLYSSSYGGITVYDLNEAEVKNMHKDVVLEALSLVPVAPEKG